MSQQEAISGNRLRVVPPQRSRIEQGATGREAMSFLNAAWPIGSIFLGTVTTNPATLLGVGTWTQIQTGIWASISSIDIYIFQRTA